MSINERIIEAVTPIVPTCVPGVYVPGVGEENAVYCTFNYSESPDSFGDDAPEAMRYLCQLHFYAPQRAADGMSNNTLATRKALRRTIFAAGFTYPSAEDASDEEYQHYVLEFQDVDGEV